LHITTKPDVIRQLLLFNTGEPVSVQRIEETERLLRSRTTFTRRASSRSPIATVWWT
jgi:hypothetical protein